MTPEEPHCFAGCSQGPASWLGSGDWIIGSFAAILIGTVLFAAIQVPNPNPDPHPVCYHLITLI